MKRKLYTAFLISFFLMAVSGAYAQPLSFNYNVTGYFFHPTSTRPLSLKKVLSETNEASRTYEGFMADLGPASFTFSLDDSNHVVNFRYLSSLYTGGLMTQDNPGGYSYYPGTTTGFTSDVYSNTYDSATKTFYLHYGYNLIYDSTTGQASYTRQVYEKWQAVEADETSAYVSSFSPQSGSFGTVITAKGTDFLRVSTVLIGGVNQDSFTAVSDTEMVITAGYAQTGSLEMMDSVSQIFSIGTADFIYTPPVVQDSGWQPVGSKGLSAGAAGFVSLAMDTASLPVVVYQDRAGGNAAMVMRYGADSLWHLLGGQASGGPASWMNIAVGTDNVPYIAYIDSTGSHPGITVRRFSNGSWQTVGQPLIDTLSGTNFREVSLALDSSNAPYILGNSHSADGSYYYYLHRFNGSSWEVLNQTGREVYAGLGDAGMAIDRHTNTVYIVSDNGSYGHYQGIVYRYHAGYWDTIPTGYITQNRNGVYYPDIALDKDGVPTVSFQDDDGRERVSVYQIFNNHSYPYGQMYFSGNHAYNISLAVNSYGLPYVFYNDYSYNAMGSVMTPDIDPANDGNWQYLGARGFASSQNLSKNDIVTDRANIPYVAFADGLNGGKVTVLKYGGYDLFAPRTKEELYSDSACRPWTQSYPGWTSGYSEDTTGTHLEIQTQFQDEPGNLCGFQSYIDSSATYRRSWIRSSDVLLSPRNYRITFSDSNFTHPVGVRLFGLTKEIDTLLAQANAYGGGRTADQIVIYRYDGANEDYLMSNNVGGYVINADSNLYKSNYTPVYNPAIHYYGANNEYYYFEFTTDHFSEFYSGIPLVTLLPVNLVSFSAAAHDKMASLVWQTSNEVNTSSFTVQRSTDGVHFTSVGKVNAAGTGGSHSYSYRDDVSGISSATVYYRLLITDKDGSVRTSGIVSVDFISRKLITIQPNPAHSYAVINCNIAGKKTITITDMNGRKVLVKTTANNSERIAVSSFAKGLYLVRTDYTNGYDVQKLVVE